MPTLVAKAAYFFMCAKCPVPHGVIVCTDDSKMACYSKRAARDCVETLLKNRLMAEIEKPGLLEQIENSDMVEHSNRPLLFFPARQSRDTVFAQSGGTPVLNTAVDQTLAAELNIGPGGHTLH